ncbi:MAG: response regulator [Gammaproteobacteria bacterium]|nr:response regulator [Gammaproteobacteria bacterium]
MNRHSPAQGKTPKSHIRLTGLFLALAGCLVILVSLYWIKILEPKLYSQAQSNASVLAQSQSHNILRAALSRDAKQNVANALNEILLLTDTETEQPFTLGVSLEFDYEVLNIPEGNLNISRGEVNCDVCFVINVPLYAETSPELVGIATIYASSLFFEQIRGDIRKKLIIGSTIFLLVIIFIWLAVSELVHKLELSEKAAEAATRVKSAFLANMSHEIRTPLNGILGMAHLLQRSQPSSQQQDYIEAISDSGEMLLVVLNDILDFSKMDAGKLSLIYEDFNLEDLIKSIMLLMSYRAEEKGIKLTVIIPQDIPLVVNGDSVRLRQVLQNLIGNAIKFTEHGSVIVSILNITSSANKIHIEISVVDTGIGIAESTKDFLFDEFTQADSSITRKYGGTGLGLNICKQLIELMNGSIDFESTPGHGSTFKFQIELNPAKDEHLIEASDKPIDIKKPKRNLEILLVEDVEINRKVASSLLTYEGHHVTEAVNGHEALKAVNNKTYDLILMDIHMPELDGIEATRSIRAMTNLDKANLPIIALTANIMEEELMTCRDVGMNGIITKPFTPEKLNEEIAKIINQ